MYCFTGIKEEKMLRFFTTKKKLLGLIDKRGTVKLKCTDARVLCTDVKNSLRDLKVFWESVFYRGVPGVIGELYIVVGSRILDLSNIELWKWEQIESMARIELQQWPSVESVILIGVGRLPSE